MKARIIISLIIISLKTISQESISDSTTWTFTVKPDSDVQSCSPGGDSQKFKVIESNYKGSIGSIFILKDNIHLSNIDHAKTYVVKGVVITKKEWIYGCFSSRKEETRFYVTPLNPTPLIVKRNY